MLRCAKAQLLICQKLSRNYNQLEDYSVITIPREANKPANFLAQKAIKNQIKGVKEELVDLVKLMQIAKTYFRLMYPEGDNMVKELEGQNQVSKFSN